MSTYLTPVVFPVGHAVHELEAATNAYVPLAQSLHVPAGGPALHHPLPLH